MSANSQTDNGFEVVARKARKAKVPEVKERILVCSDAHDWAESLNFSGEIQSFKDLESYAEKKRLPWYYHGFSPDRRMIYTIIKGKHTSFEADQDYIDHVIYDSNAPEDIKEALQG